MSTTPSCNLPTVIKCLCNLLLEEIARLVLYFHYGFFIIASIELQQNWYTGKEAPANRSQHGNNALVGASVT